MVSQPQATATALTLASRAAELLDAVGDRPSALRLRHTIAIIRTDGKYPAPEGREIPLALMKMALALLDREGPTSQVTATLQEAIDVARQAQPGDNIDPDLLAPFLPDEPRDRSN